VDLGDWQEMSRLRFENHAWHRCMEAILEAIERPGATSTSIAEAVDRSVTVLNDSLVQVHRRPVARRSH
jgi:hypothetical protein